MSTNEIIREMLHEQETAERVVMIARVQRKRAQRERTLTRRAQRAVKYVAQGRD